MPSHIAHTAYRLPPCLLLLSLFLCLRFASFFFCSALSLCLCSCFLAPLSHSCLPTYLPPPFHPSQSQFSAPRPCPITIAIPSLFPSTSPSGSVDRCLPAPARPVPVLPPFPHGPDQPSDHPSTCSIPTKLSKGKYHKQARPNPEHGRTEAMKLGRTDQIGFVSTRAVVRCIPTKNEYPQFPSAICHLGSGSRSRSRSSPV